MDCMNKLQVVVGDAVIGMHGDGFSYLFSVTRAGMESLVRDGKEWLYRAPLPTFWRALTDNDRGSGFGVKSGMWLAADCFIRKTSVTAAIDGVSVAVPMAPANNACNGAVEAKQAEVEGLSGETYPDRMAGGIPGVYEVEGLPVTPYMVPQDCGMHMQTKWVEVYRSSVLNNVCTKKQQTGLCFRAEDGKDIAFACLPYTAPELENATHHEELPPPRRTVLTVLGAVRGVGGIDSWGTDVEPAYHISAEEDIVYGFWIGGTMQEAQE